VNTKINVGRPNIYFALIDSVAGRRVPVKEASFYSATKHAVTALTEGLRMELVQAKSHIRVSVKRCLRLS